LGDKTIQENDFEKTQFSEKLAASYCLKYKPLTMAFSKISKI